MHFDPSVLWVMSRGGGTDGRQAGGRANGRWVWEKVVNGCVGVGVCVGWGLEAVVGWMVE